MEDFFLEFSLAKAVKAIVVGAEGSARGSGVGGEGEILGIGSQCASGIGYGMILVIVCLGIVVIDGTNTSIHFRTGKGADFVGFDGNIRWRTRLLEFLRLSSSAINKKENRNNQQSSTSAGNSNNDSQRQASLFELLVVLLLLLRGRSRGRHNHHRSSRGHDDFVRKGHGRYIGYRSEDSICVQSSDVAANLLRRSKWGFCQIIIGNFGISCTGEGYYLVVCDNDTAGLQISSSDGSLLVGCDKGVGDSNAGSEGTSVVIVFIKDRTMSFGFGHPCILGCVRK
mmetsp:Transcript_12806/g.32268  ORF Transcript_12806/g.32268 Transcript_12806/m.32268 type:complete len:283 (+) Transcript_12806:427-1275(+)